MSEYQVSIRFDAGDDAAADVVRRELSRGAVRLDPTKTHWQLSKDAAPAGAARWSRSAILEVEATL